MWQFLFNRVQNICLYMNQLIAPRISLWIQEAFHFSHILIPYFIVIAYKWSVQIFLRTWNSFTILYFLYLNRLKFTLDACSHLIVHNLQKRPHYTAYLAITTCYLSFHNNKLFRLSDMVSLNNDQYVFGAQNTKSFENE